MHQQLILGIPWLKQENPALIGDKVKSVLLKWTNNIPACHRQESMDDEEVQCLRTLCSAKAFQQEMKLQSPAFVGILRAVKSKDKDGQSGEDTSTEVEKIKREDFAR